MFAESSKNTDSVIPSSQTPLLSHYICDRCDKHIPDSSVRYHILFYEGKDRFNEDYCYDCFNSFTKTYSDWGCEFFEVSFLSSQYSCSHCKNPISNKNKRFHYCLSDDGNINLCAKCFSKFRNENKYDSINSEDNYVNNFTHSFHFRSTSHSYLCCQRSFPYKYESANYLYANDYKGEKKDVKTRTINVCGYVNNKK
jgi:hypothetical protein